MTKPVLSVVIPCLGRERELRRAVLSVLDQQVALEVIVVDDATPTPIALDGLDGPVSIVRLAANQGAAAARNAGVAAARADWIAFLDSDDAWPQGALAPRLRAAFDSPRPETRIWTAAFVDVWPNGRRRTRRPRVANIAEDFAAGCWTCPGSTALFARSAWAASGGQDPALRRQEDYEWLLRWALGGGQVAVYPGIGAEISRGGRGQPTDVVGACAHIRARHGALPAPWRRRMESYLNLELGVAFLHHGQWVEGSAALARSWGQHPRLQASLERFWAQSQRADE